MSELSHPYFASNKRDLETEFYASFWSSLVWKQKKLNAFGFFKNWKKVQGPLQKLYVNQVAIAEFYSNEVPMFSPNFAKFKLGTLAYCDHSWNLLAKININFLFKVTLLRWEKYLRRFIHLFLQKRYRDFLSPLRGKRSCKVFLLWVRIS